MMVSKPSHRITPRRIMPAMVAMLRIRFLSATGEALQAWGKIESYLASRLNGEKIFASGSVSGKGVIRPSGVPLLRDAWHSFRAFHLST
jgi:hypothetical protein